MLGSGIQPYERHMERRRSVEVSYSRKVSHRLDAAGNKTGDAVKEHPPVIRLGEMRPPEVGLVLREDARGDGIDDVPAKEQLEEIVGNCKDAERNRDIGHPDFPQQAR